MSTPLKNRKHAIEQMRMIFKNFGGDPESAHAKGDELLCSTLRLLGYGELVNEWEKLPKWYA